MASAGTSDSTSGNGDGSEDLSEEASLNPPSLRDAGGKIDLDSVPEVIQWFLDFDQRVAIVKHPNVEEVFHWKQENSRRQGEVVLISNRRRTASRSGSFRRWQRTIRNARFIPGLANF